MLLATLLAAACTDVPAAPEDTEILLSVQSGDDQVWIAGYELPDALVVKVTGVRDRPVPHFQVNFRVIEGGGSMYAGSGHTDPHGIARDYWTLGPEPGENVVEVRLRPANYGREAGLGEVHGDREALATSTHNRPAPPG
jgi:hypothetical protein